MEIRATFAREQQAFYRLYAAFFFHPERERWDLLSEGGAALCELMASAKNGGNKRRLSVLRELMSQIDSVDTDTKFETLQGEWVRLFGASRDAFCCPHEGGYIDPASVGTLLASLQKQYAWAGVSLSTNELPDHIAVELEYMSHLCGLEADGKVPVERAWKAQYAFLQEHLLAWLPHLASAVEKKGSGLYVTIVRSVLTFVREHLQVLRDLLPAGGDEEKRRSPDTAKTSKSVGP